MKREEIQEKDLQEELKAFHKPKNLQKNPYNDLDSRQFEILLYDIYKEKIKNLEKDVNGKFDKVAIMTGVAEKGRDVILTLNNNNVGLIQCKKEKEKISKPKIVREIIKFLLNYILEPSIITDIDNFTYIIAHSTGYSNPTVELLTKFNEFVNKESDLDKWISKVKNLNSVKIKG